MCKNKKVVHLLTILQVFFYQTNQWILYCKWSIVNLILVHNTKTRNVFVIFLLRLYFISQSLHCILHIIYCNLFHKKLIYKKLGLRGLKLKKLQELSLFFQQNFPMLKIRRQCKEYPEIISLHCYATVICKAHKIHQTFD